MSKTQREKTPIGQKSGQPKTGSHSTTSKPPLTSKSSSQSLNTKLQATAKPTANGKKQKKKKQIYDVNVTIDLVSAISQTLIAFSKRLSHKERVPKYVFAFDS